MEVEMPDQNQGPQTINVVTKIEHSGSAIKIYTTQIELPPGAKIGKTIITQIRNEKIGR